MALFEHAAERRTHLHLAQLGPRHIERRLRAIERVLGERLAAAGLAQQVRLQGRDEAAGLFLAVTPAPGMAAEAVVGLEADVRALMGPFAIRWAWLP